MSAQVNTFEVGTLDLTGFDEPQKASSSDKPRYLKRPGRYEFTIVESKLYANENGRDGAGKLWGSLMLVADNEDGYRVREFIKVPLEAAVHTSKNGKASNIPMVIFKSLLTALGHADTKVEDAINSLHEIAAPGTKFIAEVDYKGDSIRGAKDEGAERPHFNIIMKSDGSKMVDDLGNELRFSDFNSAQAHYRTVKGFSPVSGVGYTKFLRSLV